MLQKLVLTFLFTRIVFIHLRLFQYLKLLLNSNFRSLNFNGKHCISFVKYHPYRIVRIPVMNRLTDLNIVVTQFFVTGITV